MEIKKIKGEKVSLFFIGFPKWKGPRWGRLFPLARHKDLYEGHSWASGITPQGNGKSRPGARGGQGGIFLRRPSGCGTEALITVEYVTLYEVFFPIVWDGEVPPLRRPAQHLDLPTLSSPGQQRRELALAALRWHHSVSYPCCSPPP